MFSCGTLCASGLLVILCISFQEPGIKAVGEAEFPLDAPLSRTFGTSYLVIQLISLPVLVNILSSSTFAFSKILWSMANSGLFPPALAMKRQLPGCSEGTFAASVLTGSFASMILLFSAAAMGSMFLWVLSAGWFAVLLYYMGGCAAYIIFKLHLSELPRSFVSPVGSYGVAAAAFIIFIIFVCGLLHLNNRSFAITVFVLFLASIYYFLVGKDRQRLSPEERNITLAAHVAKGKLK
jgi:amino acid permease